MNKKLLIILFLAFLVRLIALNQSLWLDEAVTANVVSNFSYSEIITKFSPSDFHPPFFYLVEKFWTNIFGYSEIALRFPSIIFSLITGWMIYLIGKGWKVGKLEGGDVGVWAAALFLFNPLIIYYSQEARPYMLVTMFVTLIIYYLINVLSELTGYKKTRNNFKNFNLSRISNFGIRILLINLFIFLSSLTFYGSIFFIAAIYIWLIFKKQYRLLLMALPGFVMAGVLICPLFVQQYINSKIALSSVANWDLVLGQANLKNLLLIPIKFSIGRISFEPKTIYWIISGAWTTYLFNLILRPKLHLRGVIFLALFFITLGLGFIASFFTPILQYFRFLYLIPLLSLLLAMPKTVQPTRLDSWHGWVVLIGFLTFSLIYLLNPVYYREDWKSLVSDLKTNSVYMIPSSSDPVKYYDKKVEVRDLKAVAQLELEDTIIVIPYTAEIHGINYAETLEKLGYGLRSEKSFRELKVEIWKL